MVAHDTEYRHAGAAFYPNGSEETSHLYAWLQLKNDDILFEKKKKSGLNEGPLLHINEEDYSGSNTVAKLLVKASNRSDLLGKDALEVAEIDQWLDISNEIEENLFNMLNEYLTERVYLIEDKITLADILLYVRIHQKMKKVSSEERDDGTFPMV